MSTFSTYDSTVNSFYLAFYGRPADPAGLKFWTEQLANNNGELGAITQAFATSEEAQVRFGTDSVNDRIAEIYQQLFNRAPDADGLAYWTGVIERGNASMADVAVAILKGARDSDATLSQLRQQAADAFTAEVEAGGTQYSGYASIEAARVLVRAVTADATAADMDVLVKAAVSFADTATKNPQVVEAIAVNTTLLALFDSARGVKEPVALAKALADTAKAAAGDPVTLESLLRGGGMDKVLKVMPANATLKDVVDALAKGGLPAAVEVVYPTAPSTPSVPSPTFSLELSFETVKQGDFDLNLKDNITNQSTADVTFSYVGRDLRAGQHFEYSLDGVNYSDKNVETDAATNTVVLKGVQLGHPQHITTFGSPDMSVTTPVLPVPNLPIFPLPTLPTLPTLPNVPNVPNLDPFNKVTTIFVRAVDSSGASTKPFVQKIVYDGFVTQPLVALKNDTFHKQLGNNTDLVTKDGSLDVTNVEPGAKVDYVVISHIGPSGLPTSDPNSNSNTGVDQPPVNAEWTKAPQYEQGLNTVWVRVTDIAGNQSFRKFDFTLDSVAPKTPTIELHGNSSTSATPVQIDISGLEDGPDSAWEYSLDGGSTWMTGNQAVIEGETTLTVTNVGTSNVVVRQFDQAGNVSEQTTALKVTIEEAPKLIISGGEIGLMVQTNVSGDIVLGTVPSSSETSPALAQGTSPNPAFTLVAQQATPMSGVITVLKSDNTQVRDQYATEYHLGSGANDTISGARAWGFDGDDIMTATTSPSSSFAILYGGNGNDKLTALNGDRLYGGAGDDELISSSARDLLVGGSGADIIRTNGGSDLIEIERFSDSNMIVELENGSLKLGGHDVVYVTDYSKIEFNLPGTVKHAVKGTLDAPASETAEDVYAALTTGYNLAANGVADTAVLLKGLGVQYLVLDNGDQKIDHTDIVIQIVADVQIVGSNNISVENGNVMYTNGLPD
jgi:hypothetical protein